MKRFELRISTDLLRDDTMFFTSSYSMGRYWRFKSALNAASNEYMLWKGLCFRDKFVIADHKTGKIVVVKFS